MEIMQLVAIVIVVSLALMFDILLISIVLDIFKLELSDFLVFGAMFAGINSIAAVSVHLILN